MYSISELDILGFMHIEGGLFSHFLKEWFDGLIALVGFEWQVFLKE